MTTLSNHEREDELRKIGQKLDRLWVEARHATGQARADIQNKMRPLREQQRLIREAHNALKPVPEHPASVYPTNYRS